MAVEEVGVKLLAENSDKFSRDTKAAQRALDNFIHSVESGAGDIGSGMKQSERAVESFATSSEKSFRRIDAFAEIAIGALRRVGEVAVNALFEAGRATADFIGDSVSVAGDFESTLNRFAAVTGDSLSAAGMEVSDFSDLFLEMGALTAYSAGEAAEAAVALAKGGITPAAIAAGGLEAALSLAAAGELDLAASAEILAKQLGVWTDKGVTAIDITNLLAQAANASTVDVAELARGLANVQGRAAAMGLEYEDLVQTMAVIAPGFSDASQAGTSLNNFLARLIPTTEAAKEAMMDLGLVTADGSSLFFDAEGNFIGARDAIGLLSAATADLSEEEKSMAFQIIFGNDAMGAASLLAEKGVPAYDAMGASMEAAGSAADQAAKRNQGYNFALEEMGGSLETLQIVLGTALLPLLTEFIQNHITPGINKIMEFAQSITESTDPMGTLVTRIDELLPGFKSFLDTATNLPNRIIEIANALTERFAPEIQLAQSIFETAMIVIDKIATSVIDTVMGAIDEFTSNLSTNSTSWNKLLESFQLVWTNLEPIIGGILATLGALLLVFLGVVTGVITGIINAIDPFLEAWANVLGFISVILGGIQELVMGFVDLVVALFQGNTEGVLQALHRMQDGALAIVIGLVGAIISGIEGLINTGLALFEGFILGIIEFFARLYDDLVGNSIIPELVEDILVWFARLPERALALIGEMITGIKSLFTDTDWGAVGRGIIDGITDGLTSAATSLATAARDAASSAYNAVTDFLQMDSPSKLFFGVGLNTMDSSTLGVEEGAPRLIAAMESVFSALAVDVPQMLPQMIADTAATQGGPTTINNSYNYEAPTYAMNVRTQESVGTIGNTVKALQAISRIRGR